jgi:hypothetical protein
MGEGDWLFARGEIQLGRLGRITLTMCLECLVCDCANHTRPTRGTRRELGLKNSSNKELVNICQYISDKSHHEVSRIRRVLLVTAAQLCRNISENRINDRNYICECLSPGVYALDAH